MVTQSSALVMCALCIVACGQPASAPKTTDTTPNAGAGGSVAGNAGSAGSTSNGGSSGGTTPSTGGGTTEGGSTGAGGSGAVAGTGGDSSGPIQHRFFAIDNEGNRLLYVDESTPEQSWDVALPTGARDLQQLNETTLLVSHGDGAGEYAIATGAAGWSVSGFSNVQTATRLSNGNTLLGQATSDATFLEVTSDGTVVDTVTATGVSELRLARRLDNGHTLFTGTKTGFVVIEVDADGASVWEKPLPGKGYVATCLPSGNTLVTTGEALTLLELDVDGTELQHWGGAEDHPDARLRWFSGFQALENGHVVVANWLGHGMEGSGPHVVEFDEANQLVWQWEDHTAAQTVTNALVLE